MTGYLYFLSMVVFLRSSPIVGLPARRDIIVSHHGVAHVGIRPRSEIDLTTEKQVLFCAGQNKSLECVSPGSTIAIMDTFWGRLTDSICPSEDGDPTTNCASDSSTTPLLKNLCDDKVFCEIPARHTVLQAPGTSHCPGVNKYLIVNYTCMPIERKFVLCDGETTSLQCGQGWKLNIQTALWGRISPATCATILGRPSRLGKCESSNSTLEKIQSICQGRNGCVVRADDKHMVQGTEQHCPDVDKYAMISYRCQPKVPQVTENTLQTSKESFLNSDQGFLPEIPTKRISFINQDSQSNDNPTNTNTNKPYLLEATNPTNVSPLQHKHETNINLDQASSLDGLLQEYMESQGNQGGGATASEQLSIPHDGGPPPKVKLGVPQDNANENLQQNIALLKKILHSKKIMKVGTDARVGIDMATAISEPRRVGSKEDRNTNSNSNGSLKQLNLSQDELNRLAHSSDAIKIINEYMNRNKTKQDELTSSPQTTSQQVVQNPQQANISKITTASSNTNSPSQNDNNSKLKKKVDTKVSGNQHSEQMSTTKGTTTRKPSLIVSTISTTAKPTQKDINKLMDPTARLGGKVMGNLFYDKFLKPAQEDFKNQAKSVEQKTEGTAIDALRKKISALQAISDALMLITSKMDPVQGGGKRHHEGRQGNHLQGNDRFLEMPENVGQKDVQFLQDQINKAIETTEAMERQAAFKNPSLVALNLKGKVAEDVQAEARNIVQQRKERIRIDSQIKGIEDSFNTLIEKAEKSGKFSDRNISNKPTSNLFEQIQNGAFKMSFNDDQSQGSHVDNTTKGIYGFEVVSQEPVINIINEKDSSIKNNTVDASTPVSATNNLPQKTSEMFDGNTDRKPLDNTNLPVRSREQNTAVHLAPKTTSKAANLIANALRRQASKQSLSSIALQPITTFHNFQDVTLGGRINSEVIKEKEKEKVYKGKDVNALLNIIRSRPTFKTPLVQSLNKVSGQEKQVPGKDLQVTGKDLQVPGKDLQVPGKDLQVTGKDLQVPGKDLQVPGKDLQVPGKDIQVTGKDDQVAEVQNVGKLDEKSMKILSVLVQGFLERNRRISRKHSHRRRKKKGHTELEQEDFVIGTKHDEVKKSTENTKILDKGLLEMLEKQLTNAQKDGYKIENLVSDAQGSEGVDDDTVKSVPNDKEKKASPDILIMSPTVKPMPAPSDDPSLELINKYTSATHLDSLLLGLQRMLKQGKIDIENEKKKGISSEQESVTENPSKTSLSPKPRVVEFSGAATSGRIVNSLDDGKATDNKDSQVITQFAGGRILEPGTAGLKPVSKETFSIINANPTAKSKVGAKHENTPTSKLKLKNLVSGVKLLLKALRGKHSESHGGHHEGKLGKNDQNSDNNDDVDSLKPGEVDNETDEGFNLPAFKGKERTQQERVTNDNDFLGYVEPKHKEASSRWYVGDGNSYKSGFNQLNNYGYDDQYDMNLAQQYNSNPKEYSTFTPDRYSVPFTGFALQPPNPYEYYPKQTFQDPFAKPAYSNKLANPAKHELNSVLKNDPIIQAVEEFSDNETKLYNERLRGIQKSHIPGKDNKAAKFQDKRKM